MCAHYFFFVPSFLSFLPWFLQCVSSGESSRAAPSTNFFFFFSKKQKGNSGEKKKKKWTFVNFVDLFFYWLIGRKTNSCTSQLDF